ncbi:MAG: PadR family transcriptional regulator [Actinomycetota bacterium]|nr:PadR family transcriptional regulator [Actinomycetota bacterium]
MAEEPKGGNQRRVAEAVAEATKAGEAAAVQRKRGGAKRGGRPSDALGGDIRRRDIFPLLVLHLVAAEPTYGNRLIEAIEEMTQGVISVNPNTMYPLLRSMERDGMVEGRWELPDRRTRRYYSITPAGKREYKRLLAEVEPFIDSVISSMTLVKREVYGS